MSERHLPARRNHFPRIRVPCPIPGPACYRAGMAQGPVVDPEVVARKVAAMSLGRAQARVAAEAQLLSEVTSFDLEGLRRRASMRQCLCAVGEASGATEPELARLVGLKGGKVSVHRLKKHPVVRRSPPG